MSGFGYFGGGLPPRVIDFSGFGGKIPPASGEDDNISPPEEQEVLWDNNFLFIAGKKMSLGKQKELYQHLRKIRQELSVQIILLPLLYNLIYHASSHNKIDESTQYYKKFLQFFGEIEKGDDQVIKSYSQKILKKIDSSLYALSEHHDTNSKLFFLLKKHSSKTSLCEKVGKILQKILQENLGLYTYPLDEVDILDGVSLEKIAGKRISKKELEYLFNSLIDSGKEIDETVPPFLLKVVYNLIVMTYSDEDSSGYEKYKKIFVHMKPEEDASSQQRKLYSELAKKLQKLLPKEMVLK